MMRKPLLAVAVLTLLAVAVPRSAPASSTDLALFATSAVGWAPPNIMFLFDTSSSMLDLVGEDDSNDEECDPAAYYCKWEMARDVLIDVVRAVNPPDGNGGYVQNARFGVFLFDSDRWGGRLIVPIRDGNTGTLINRVANMDGTKNNPPSGDINSGTPLGIALTDVGRYFAGAPGWGYLPVFGPSQMTDSYGPEPNVPSPIDVECRSSYVIALSDGRASDQDHFEKYGDDKWCDTIGDADNDGNDDSCSGTPGESDDRMDDVAYVMNRTDFSPIAGTQNLIVHTIGFDLADPGILADTATNGGGTLAMANDYAQLYNSFITATQSIFDGLISFSAPTVPSKRTEGDGSFYYSSFRPDFSKAFWQGFIYAYSIEEDGDIIDANGDLILSTGTGFIDPNTPNHWEAGELLKANPSRDLLTTKGGVPRRFNTANILEADLNLTSAEISSYPNYNALGVNITNTNQLMHALVNYIHGKDAFDDDGDADTNEMRDAVLGDIFHSSPVTVGHPTQVHAEEEGFGPAGTAGTFLNLYGNRDRVLYAGANDGMLHAFHAGVAGDNPATLPTEDDYYDPGTGEELFGYIPGILLPTIKMIPRNKPRAYYYVDGASSVADAWLGASHAYSDPKTADEWATVLVTGMREGGEGYLALDVTDPSATAGAHGPYPKLLWEFTHGKLGESWSEPILTRVKVRGSLGLGDRCGHDSGDGDCREQWVAIFGGGYREDANPNKGAYVSDPSSGTWSNKSKSIFMVSLDTGDVVGSATFDASDASANGLGNMKYGFPSAPAVLDLDFDGFADVVYIGDLGGQMWKWDISAVGEDSDIDGDYDNWPAAVFFRAYTSAAWSGGPDRYHSFFFPPAASFARGKLILAFGSGEREDLQYKGNAATTAENNRFYVIRDEHPTGLGAFGSVKYEDDLTDVTDPTVSPDPANLGFFFMGIDGEKFLTEHIIFAGYVITTSYSPDSSGDICMGGNGGDARLYVFDLFTGEGFFADASSVTGKSREITVGHGLPTGPQLSLGGTADRLFVKTSTGAVTSLAPPGGNVPPISIIYWRQVF
jgi:type IV pilus assembly protein PilY1